MAEILEKLQKIEDYTALEYILQEEFVHEYKVQYSLPADDKIWADDLCANYLIQCTQYLTDLGYFDDYPTSWEDKKPLQDIISALKNYYSEDFILQESLALELEASSIFWLENMPIILQRLAVLVSVDAEMEPLPELKLGALNLYTRILHYRLWFWGAYNKYRKLPINSFTFQALSDINRCLGAPYQVNDKTTNAEFSSNLGNIKALLTLFIKSTPYPVLFYQNIPSNQNPIAAYPYIALIETIPNTPKKWVLAKNEAQWERLAKRQVNVSYQKIAEQLDFRGKYIPKDEKNQFGLLLLKRRLWSLGLFEDKLSTLWTDKEHDALVDYLSSLNDARNKHIFNQLLIPLAGNTWAIQLEEVSDMLINSLLVSSDEFSEAEQELILGRIEAQKVSLNRLTQKVKEAENNATTEKFNLLQRISRSLRAIWYAIRKGIDMIFRWIKGTVHKVTGIIISFFKDLLHRLKNGIRILFDHAKKFVHFLLRKPIATPELDEGTPQIISKFDLDWDNILYVDARAMPEMILLHQQKIRRLLAVRYLCMRIGIEFFRLIASLATFNWVMFGYRLFRVVFVSL